MEENDLTINVNDIKEFYLFLDHKSISELRPIKPRWKQLLGEQPPSIFVNNIDDLINEINKFNGRYNIYIGINSRDKKGKEDIDVKYITNIGHDIDSHNSEENKFIAGQVALEIRDDCINQGFNEPLIIDSGRGYWVIHHISPIENTEENVKKIKEFGNRIKKKYEKEGIEIDSAVYNPSRIVRVPGTLNISDKDRIKKSKLINNPKKEEDKKLTEEIIKIQLPVHINQTIINSNNSGKGIDSFMDYCLTHKLPQGERHKVISRNMAIYLSDHPNREFLKQQYIKIQDQAPTEIDNWLKGIDENGKDKFPYSIGELIKFTKKYKIPFDWKLTPEYQQWKQLIKSEQNIQKEIKKEEKAEQFGKAIKFFTDKKHLAEQFLEVQPLYYDNAKLWWIWIHKKKCWEICDETDIMNYISDNSEADTITSSEKNEILEALRQSSRKHKPKILPNSCIQFKDIIVNIETGERTKASQEYFITNPIPWDLGRCEDTPIMDKIFGEWVGEKNKRVLYEILAYCLLLKYPIHRIFCFIGSGMNGKTCFLNLLRKFVGESNCCTTELDTLLSSRFEVTRLHKKLVCQMGETNFSELSKTSLLKKLSGGDSIGFEYKNKNPFEDFNYAKILISTNNLPATTDKTIGFYRRWMIIDFPNEFSEKKEILNDIPEEEYKNLALKSITILKELLLKREFTNEGTIQERMDKYENKSNFLEQFIKKFVMSDSDGFITVNDFHKRFNSWCKENHYREMSETTLSLDLKKLGLEQTRKYFNWMYEGKGGQARVWVGVKWKD